MKKGFTLVELLAVLTLLAFVAIIATPIMEEILDKSATKTKASQVKEIIEAAKKYVIKYDEKINYDEDNEAILMLSDLKKSEFLNDEKIVNAETNEEFNGCVYIKYDEETSKTKYAYFYECETINDTSGCFFFEDNTIYGYDNNNCIDSKFTIPTYINGEKVKYIAAGDGTSETSYLYRKSFVDFKKALFLEKIGDDAFKKMTIDFYHFEKLDLSNNSLLTEIGENSFYHDTLRIDTIKFPDNLKIIGMGAFRDSKMKKLILPDKLEKIGRDAFKNNELEKVSIPSSVSYIGDEAFGENKLLSVTINGKSSVNDFSYYNNPFINNESFDDSKIIWKK